MKRISVKILIGCLLFSITMLSVVFMFSPLNQAIYRGAFERRFIRGNMVVLEDAVDLGYNSFYFAGQSNDAIYLGNSTAPLRLISIQKTLSLEDLQHVRLVIPKTVEIAEPGLLRLSIASPFFFLTEGTMPMILRGQIGKWRAVPLYSGSGAYFVETVPIAGSSLILRSYHLNERSYELGKLSIYLPQFAFQTALLEKQVDGMFCVDGRLHYSEWMNRVVYVYYYRNQFVVADSSLSLVYRANTLDTFRHAQIEVQTIKSRREVTLSKPPMLINGLSRVVDTLLFIQSNVMGKNENQERFLSGTTIDVYHLADGAYCWSFWLANYRNKKLYDFWVFKGHLIAIFGNFLVSYELKELSISDHQQGSGSRKKRIYSHWMSEYFTGKGSGILAEHLKKPK